MSVSQKTIEARILDLRGQKVILDSDLARTYGVTTKRLNEQVKRNANRFPEDFMFQLSKEEWESFQPLRSQNATLKRGQHRKYLPYVFTEHGALMAANILNSSRSIEMSVFIVRAFVKMREQLLTTATMAKRLAEVEKLLLVHDSALGDLYQKIQPLLMPPEEPEKKRIGFDVKESRARYRTKKPKDKKGKNKA